MLLQAWIMCTFSTIVCYEYTQFVPVLIHSIVHINRLCQDEKGKQPILSYKSTKIPNSSKYKYVAMYIVS